MRNCQWLTTEATNLRERVRDFHKETNETTQTLTGLYFILTTLDSKASGLLRVNSIFIAVLAVLLGWLFNKNSPAHNVPHFWYLVTYGDGIVFVASSLLCLGVVRVSWSFFGKATRIGKKYTFDVELDPLAKTVVRRTVCYRLAWYLTLIALLSFVVLAIGVLSNL